MIDFEQELQDLNELYGSLENQLENLNHSLQHNSRWESDSAALSGELIQKLIKLDHHIERLGSDWGAEKLNRSAIAREDIAKKARRIQVRAQRLLDLARGNEKLLKQHQRAARESLQQVRRGVQFLESARGYRENHPKFIDTRR